MSYHKSRIYAAPVPKMPPGLIELMENLSKEVLKNNPSNIYEFCAGHIEKLLQLRDSESSDKAINKTTLRLKRRISKAQEIIRERAKLRYEQYPTIKQETIEKCATETTKNSFECEQELNIELENQITCTTESIETDYDNEKSVLSDLDNKKESKIDIESEDVERGQCDRGQCKVMDLETAAITIQKVFRSFLFKSKTTSVDDATNLDINLFVSDESVKAGSIKNVTDNKDRRGLSRMDTLLQTVNEEKSLSLSTDDSSTLSSAATVIQAHIRGFLVRNKLNLNKSHSTSLVDSDIFSGASLDVDSDQQKTKTVLNIHIVPERGQFTSRDESLANSMDLSIDGSLSNSTLHPNSFNVIERRKQLKREDAVQSVSPPSNNSSLKLSEDIDSVKEVLTVNYSDNSPKKDSLISSCNEPDIKTSVEGGIILPENSAENQSGVTVALSHIDETINDNKSPDEVINNNLTHSSEFHEVILPTKVSRGDSSVVREFHSVLGYFLLWN